jgi:hypothetical protein
MGKWFLENWLTILNATGIIGGLFFTAHSLRHETKTRRIGNLLTLIQNHRELWAEVLRYPELARVMDANVNLAKHPITASETIFVNMTIQHLSGAYQAMKNGLVIKQDGLRRDISGFFSLPIPKAIWEKTKVMQNDDFAEFVERCRNWK